MAPRCGPLLVDHRGQGLGLYGVLLSLSMLFQGKVDFCSFGKAAGTAASLRREIDAPIRSGVVFCVISACLHLELGPTWPCSSPFFSHF